MYIKALFISNLRCFEQSELYFQYPGRKNHAASRSNMNLLLGNNGAGKTTVLQAIALATLSPIIEGAGYVPYHLIRATTNATQVEADLILEQQDVGAEPLVERVKTSIVGIRDYELLQGTRQFLKMWENIYDDDSPAFMMVGYGANRRVEKSEFFNPNSWRKSRRLRYQRVASLFEEHITLIPLSAWLPNVKANESGRFEEMVTLFRTLLPANTHFDGQMADGELLFSQFGVNVPESALSDGYRSYIGWIGDLLYHLYMTCPPEMNLLDLNGIVLVDEVDLHLHPEWQREIIAVLSDGLPNMQFILSTHSPIVAGTLASQNIFVMEQKESSISTGTLSASTVRQLEERVYGLNADQVLLSSYFNLETTRAPQFVDQQLHEIEQRAWQGDPNAAVEFLKRLAGTTEEGARP